MPGEPIHLSDALGPDSTTGEVFEQLFDEVSMTPEEFDARVAAGEPVELNVRLKSNIRIKRD